MFARIEFATENQKGPSLEFKRGQYRPFSSTAPGRVQCPQAIEQMLNARWWARLFFREQNPKPLAYFRTDRGVDV
jgi:hypothetical protein